MFIENTSFVVDSKSLPYKIEPTHMRDFVSR